MTADPDWLRPLSGAYHEPWAAAERWHAAGGRVVGVLGRLVPTELIEAGGMLPIQLSARRLAPEPLTLEVLPDGLADSLSPETATILAALLGGRLAWLDHLVLGRDTEAHTELFYVLRELGGRSRPEGVPPFAFCDLLRQPLRTSARYNRLRCRQLRDQVASWSGEEVAESAIADSVIAAREVAEGLRMLDSLRADGRITGTQALIAAGAVRVLPSAESVRLLREAAASAAAQPVVHSPGPRVWLTGSAQDDPWAYRVLEEAGARLVGEDHAWGDDGREPPRSTRDPIDGIVDRYHRSDRAAERGRLDRIGTILSRAREREAQAVLQLLHEHDGASGWELPHLRAAFDQTPVAQAKLNYAAREPAALTGALELISAERGARV